MFQKQSYRVSNLSTRESLMALSQLWASTKEFMVKVNYTFTDSEIIRGKWRYFYLNSNGGVVTAAASLLANGRDPRLQGQAENIFNLQFGYDDYSVNSQATVIVNYVDDRVRARGLDVLPDVIEQIPTND